MKDYSNILPVQDSVSEKWFKAVSEGKLLLQKSPNTGKVFYYPRSCVPGEPGITPNWIQASGFGTLYSYTVVERSSHLEFSDLTPFVLAMVDLEEGPRMTTWLVDLAVEDIRCDMPVKLVFKETINGLVMPCFSGV